MDPPSGLRWAKIERLLDQALELAPADRHQWLEQACSGSPELHREVERLLRAAESSGSFLREPASGYAAQVLARLGEQQVLAPGSRLGAYEIERELGRGGMATVYLAQDLKHNRPVALKMLHPELAAALGPERFLREIHILASLNHPHILPLHDSGDAVGRLYYVMPFVEGESLRQRLTRERQLPIADALRFTTQVASALGYAHGRGIIHRDIKPENILLMGEDAVVADFGIARALEAAGRATLTETGLAIGTPAYMSPEQAMGDGQLDGRSDLYSLGCLLYEMLAGEPPYTGPTVQAIMAKRLSDPVPSARRLREELPAHVDAAIRKTLAKAPADRFATAGALAQALAEPGARRMPVVPVRRPRRARLAMLGALGAGLAIVVGLWLTHLAQRGRTDSKRVMVAVLANRTGNPALDPVGLTAADYINRGLVQTGLVEVVDVGVLYIQGRATTGEPAEPRALAQRNGAGIVVTGSYDQSGDSLVFLASIVDAGSGRVLQALEPVQGPLGRREIALDALRQRVTVGLAGLLDPRLSELTTPSPEPPNYAAYQAFVAGQSAAWSVPNNGEEATAYFRHALKLDSTFFTAAVWVALAGVTGEASGCAVADSVARVLLPHRNRLTLLDRLLLDAQVADCRGDYEAASRILSQPAPSLSRSPQFQMFRALFSRLAGRPREAVEILTGLDPERDLGWLPDSGKALYRRDLGVPYHALGDYRNELRVARDLDRKEPNRLAGINLENHALAGLGKTSDVLDGLRRARRLPPDPQMLYPLSNTYLTLGRLELVDTPGRLCYEAALELQAHGHPEAGRTAAQLAVSWYRAQPSEQRSQPEYRYTLARSLELLGHYDEARGLIQGLSAEDSGNVDYYGVLGVLAAQRGDRAEAQRIDQGLAGLSRPYLRGFSTYYRAQIAAVLGDRNRAVELLRDAIAQGAADPWDHLHSEPAFASLHGYPPFEELLRPKA